MDIKARPPTKNGEHTSRDVLISITYKTKIQGAYKYYADVLVKLSTTNGEVDHQTLAHVRLRKGNANNDFEMVSVTGITGNELAYLTYSSQNNELTRAFSW